MPFFRLNNHTEQNGWTVHIVYNQFRYMRECGMSKEN